MASSTGRKVVKRLAQAFVVLPVSVTVGAFGVANYYHWREELAHRAEEKPVAVTEYMLTTANRCNLIGKPRPTHVHLERIRQWHTERGYGGGITFRNFDESMDEHCTVYDSIVGETERHRRESFYIYYELDGHGNRRQDIFIRGTAVKSDFYTDFCIGKEFDEETELYFHRGFLEKANTILTDLEPLLDERSTTYVAGHSLGGSVAAIIAWKLHARGFAIGEVMSFGAPKFTTVTDAPFKLVSITHERDPIPTLPPDGPTAFFRGVYCPTGEQLKIRDSEDGIRMVKLPSLPYWRHHATLAPITSGFNPHRMFHYENFLDRLLGNSFAEASPGETAIEMKHEPEGYHQKSEASGS
eukprot:GEMP01022619.1.p1 GENE.GEMP01022619.1~~GEMP01022619.1.p1  ORF type:complete len:355 (+),score=71.82 GEMP01022619.1:173-1237(+)